MKDYTWDEYYENFYDWSDSSREKYISTLTSLGPADEVAEIITELYMNPEASNNLLRKAIAEKIVFDSLDLMEFLENNDKYLANSALYNSASEFTSEDVELLYGIADDNIIMDICSKYDLMLPEVLQEDYENEFEDEDFEIKVEIDIPDNLFQRSKNKGFFSSLFNGFMNHNPASYSKKERHDGHCDGDCANCPPHYGYRHGRYYYGHDHVYGCEFGGNKGSGSIDF